MSRRRWFDVVAAVSFACFAASGVGWVRSYFVSETWTRVRHEELGYRVAGLASAEGLLALFEQRHECHGATAHYAWRAGRSQPHLGQGTFFDRQAHGTSVSAIVHRSPMYDDPWGLRTFDHVRASEAIVSRTTSFPWSMNVRMTATAVVVPWWVLVLASALMPLARVREVLRGRRRGKRGLCRACGYDLRASEGRCPECGEVIADLRRR